MNSLTDLREVVDVVIGVDTHVHTHSAAVVDTATGGVLAEITVDATAEGFQLTLDEPAYGVAAGQTAVLYDGDAVVGAGVILGSD